MKKLMIFTLLFLALLQGCMKREQTQNVIEKKEFKIENGKLTPEVMWSLGKVGEYSVSPDNAMIAYTVTYYDLDKNKGNAEIYLMKADGSDVNRLTKTSESEYNLQWAKDSRSLFFLKATEQGAQLFELSLNGNKITQRSFLPEGMEGFQISPDESKMYFIRSLPKDKGFANLYEGLDKTSGRINEDLMYRHWDHWVDDYPHVFICDFMKTLDSTTSTIDILNGEQYECPMRPFGGIEQIVWSPSSKQLVYTCRKKTGKEYAVSTNSDIYLYDISTAKSINISEGMMGYDQNPVFSPDGKKIAWEGMEHDGYESDKARLILYDIATGQKEDVSKDFDQNANQLLWSSDSKKIFFTSPWHGVIDIFSYNLDSKVFNRVSNGRHNIGSIQWLGGDILALQTSMSMPAELVAYKLSDGSSKQLSAVNTQEIKQIQMGEVKERWVTTTDKKQMLVWVIYPPHFDSTKKYPTLLYCQGGPQDMVSQFWSTRWNFQIMASAGYIVVAPNRRGLPGFGQEWNAEISGDYGGQCMKDYLSAIDDVSKESYVDKDHLGAVGASFGGFSVYWLAGNHNKRFKAFIAHNGMFNLEQQYLETEEVWFTNWDLGGAYWDKSNKIAQRSYSNSPHLFVGKWDTPLLVIHSEYDYRIVASQGMAAYNAAVLRGIPARYLYFPDENHWVLKPQNSVLWHRNFIDWLDKWLKV